jgi:hypothetical protein
LSDLFGKNYNLTSVSRFVSNPTNCQRLDSGFLNYQKVLKMSNLSKYAYNTHVMCHFSIKKKKKKNLKDQNFGGGLRATLEFFFFNKKEINIF